MYYLKTLTFTTHNRMKIEMDENGDGTGYYDVLNWQLDDDGEIAFVKVGERIFTDFESALVMKKDVTIFWNTQSSEVSHSDISFCLHVQRIAFPYCFRHLEILDTYS